MPELIFPNILVNAVFLFTSSRYIYFITKQLNISCTNKRQHIYSRRLVLLFLCIAVAELSDILPWENFGKSPLECFYKPVLELVWEFSCILHVEFLCKLVLELFCNSV